MKTQYVVYVNYWGSANIHRATCGFYDRRKADQTEHGHWAGPFETYEEAVTCQKEAGYKNMGECSYCMK